MPIGPKPPSAEQIGDLAWRLDLDLSEDEIEAYARIVGAGMAAYRRLDELAAPKPPVKYPRSPGYRPARRTIPATAGTGAPTSGAPRPARSRASASRSRMSSASPASP